MYIVWYTYPVRIYVVKTSMRSHICITSTLIYNVNVFFGENLMDFWYKSP